MTASRSPEEGQALGGAGEPVAPRTPVHDAAAEGLSSEERDALGELGRASMASAAAALSALIGHEVSIAAPRVDTVGDGGAPTRDPRAVAVSIDYSEGLHGRNVFLIGTRDASVVADLLTGGPGAAADELSESGASALAEAMHRMMRAAAASVAEMLGRRVDVAAPELRLGHLEAEGAAAGPDLAGPLARTAFELRVGDLLSTTLVQLMPVALARELVGLLTRPAAPSATPAPAPQPPARSRPEPEQEARAVSPHAPRVARPVAFPELEDPHPAPAAGDIGLLLDVPLRVTVELGRTQLRIRNVLELVPGSIIELDRLAGEPVDVLVNGKQIARGEVVVIDEEFGVRITDIASQARRLTGVAPGE